ncbi:hypothetical protein GT755_37660 [Herbidospora sp. NEAU-GS84]|uniref:Uncharacterized protein n=1 Tax=Herbidospora solisilvae TaxID=2696284 RepID=A0A7C9JKE8_9ACTN|nr:DUF6247 family protein [Herbidospora solisilvae]NAS27383.1 hypothetical protein [Herbidospora solisilvae]
MSAQPVEPHPIGHDPDEILSRLPERLHGVFLAEYRAAMVAAAHETWRWRHLAEVLTLWHLRAVTYAAPGYEAARADVAAGNAGVPAESVIPGWAEYMADRASRQAS